MWSGARTAATTKMDNFVIIVDGWKPLTIITKSPILDVTAVLDPPLIEAMVIEYKNPMKMSSLSTLYPVL